MSNQNHFAYLLEKEASVTPDRLDSFAKIAAKRFIEEKTPLNSTIQKLADENDLNHHQVERVCEMANLATHQALWPRASEKEKIAFEVADAKKVKAKEGTPSPSKGSPISADYSGPPKGIPTGGSASLMELLGLNPADQHNGLHGPSEKQRILIILQKKAAARKELQDKLLYAGMESETAEKVAYRAVKQTVLGGHSMRDVLRAACAGGLGKIAAEVLPRFEQSLIGETAGSQRAELVKMAIGKAPENLISQNLGSTTVVNGAHPVLVSLDTVQKKNDEVKNLLNGLIRIDDEVKTYNQQLKELT